MFSRPGGRSQSPVKNPYFPAANTSTSTSISGLTIWFTMDNKFVEAGFSCLVYDHRGLLPTSTNLDAQFFTTGFSQCCLHYPGPAHRRQWDGPCV